jgi:nitroimidazol reductase NimA-like FMN-containing flavoprotein (pyridoxamine 5'-phosphate oxidase superfamily)
MSPAEIAQLFTDSMTGVLTTLDRNGWPHSVGMWFVTSGMDDVREIRMWTYRKSQKVKNVMRDARCSFLVETGESYSELRGVLVRGRIRVLQEVDEVREIGKALHERYVAPFVGSTNDEVVQAEIDRQAAKRVGLVLPPARVASWDHRRLG